MMLNDDPDRRPSIRLICQALEDNLMFPREMNTKARIQESDAKSRDMHTEGISAREVAREWILNEREREKVDKKVVSNFEVPPSHPSLKMRLAGCHRNHRTAIRITMLGSAPPNWGEPHAGLP